MPNAPTKLFIVDDNKDNRDLLEDIFEEEYDVTCLSNAPDLLELAAKEPPDIVLLDVNMPEMDGYEACRKLKSKPETALIPVVFVTALASPEQRLEGYEAGAEDYVTKPFVDEIIMEIVHKVLDRKKQMVDFEKQNKEAMNTAFQAMASSAELGQIIQFLQSSFSYKSSKALAHGLLEITQQFALNCCVNVRSGYQDEYYGCDHNSIEAKVFQRFRDGDRVLDFGARTLVNGANISLLVKNMPLDKPDVYGRIKDHLIVLISGSEACVRSLEVESQLEEERQSGIQAVILKSHEELGAIRQLINEQEGTTRKVVSLLTNNIENLIFSLGLEEDQEKAIMDILDKGAQEIQSLSELTSRVETSFNQFIKDLDQLVN